MTKIFKTTLLMALTASLVGSCLTAGTSEAGPFSQKNEFPRDKARNVLSFADTLEPVLPSVVRIGRLNRNEEGKLGLKGIGSGAVIDTANGYVITNAHVVDGGEAYLINVPDGRVLEASLVGIDTPTDIAVLKADDLRVGALQLANSDLLRVGDLVFAVGYPLGLEQSLSLGVVSGLGRSNSATGLQDFIQTDAAINSGNSGGPLLDSQGHLVGINTAIVTRSGGSNGIGFSVPISLASQVTDQLIAYGEVRRGFVGIQMSSVSETDSEKVGINHWDGATVVEVRPGSTAEAAGLMPGDVITAYSGKTVKSPNALRAWIGVSEANSVHTLTYIRANGVERTVNVTITDAKQAVIQSFGELGAHIRPVKASDNVPDNVQGVYVYKIDKDSAAERSGLQVGDVISSINNEETNTMESSERMTKQSKGRARLQVYRYGADIPIIIER